MTKNFDRVVSVISLLIGLLSIAMSFYLAQPDSNTNIVSLSGWVASALITIALSFTAYKALWKLETDLIVAHDKSLKYKDDSIRHKDDLVAVQSDMASYRNISTALSSMISPDTVRNDIRTRLAAHVDSKVDHTKGDENGN